MAREEEGRRWGFVVGRISPAVMAGAASLEVKPGALGGGDWAGEDQYSVEKVLGYMDWRMWGLRRWFNGEPSSSAMTNDGHYGRARGRVGLAFIGAEDGESRAGA